MANVLIEQMDALPLRDGYWLYNTLALLRG